MRYAERMGVSLAVARQESNEDVERALMVWAFDEQRDNLEKRTNN